MNSAGGILCSGSIVYDTVVRPVNEVTWGTTSFVDSIEFHVGGNGANTSIALSRIGVRTRLLGTIGEDDHGHFVLNTLRTAGVDIVRVAVVSAPTAATIAIVNSAGDRKFLHRIGASAQAFAEPIHFTSAVIDGMAHYHLASLFVLPLLRPHASECLQRARRAGLTTSLDTNWDPDGRWMADLEPCLEHLDLLFLNEDEARMVTHSSSSSAAARVVLDKGVKTAVMKLGRRGCAIYSGGEEILCPAFDVEATDTTGAGDCFVAGFLAALRRKATMAEAGHFANAVAAMSVQRIGAVTGIPRYPEVQAWMNSARLRTDQTAAAIAPQQMFKE
jgi:sugar/nucleoside kinase (ribokinase family)